MLACSTIVVRAVANPLSRISSGSRAGSTSFPIAPDVRSRQAGNPMSTRTLSADWPSRAASSSLPRRSRVEVFGSLTGIVDRSQQPPDDLVRGTRAPRLTEGGVDIRIADKLLPAHPVSLVPPGDIRRSARRRGGDLVVCGAAPRGVWGASPQWHHPEPRTREHSRHNGAAQYTAWSAAAPPVFASPISRRRIARSRREACRRLPFRSRGAAEWC